jgi:hypothetical protein
MAYNDRGGIRTEVISYLDGRTDLDTKINRWIDDARRDVATKYDFAYLFTSATASTSAGAVRYALPSDYQGHLSMFIGTKKLIRISPNEFDAVHADDIDIAATEASNPYLFTTGSLEQDEPDYYIDRGLEFDLYPIPDAVYTITLHYYAQPAAFTSDAEYDYITTFHTEAVIFGAALRGAIYLEDATKKTDYKQEYETRIGNILQREKDRKTSDLGRRMKSYKDFNINQFKRMVKINNY